MGAAAQPGSSKWGRGASSIPSSRGMHVQGSDGPSGPGPGAYSPRLSVHPNAGSGATGRSLGGTAPRFVDNKAAAANPAPGQYDVRGKFDAPPQPTGAASAKSPAPGVHWRRVSTAPSIPDRTLANGWYETTQDGRVLFHKGAGSARRQQQQPQQRPSVPPEKEDEVVVDLSAGPQRQGQQERHGFGSSSLRMAELSSAQQVLLNPGPGQYDALGAGISERKPRSAATFSKDRSRRSDFTSHNSDMPAVGQYDVSAGLGSPARSARPGTAVPMTSTFASATARWAATGADGPAPGEYDAHEVDTLAKRVTRAPRASPVQPRVGGAAAPKTSAVDGFGSSSARFGDKRWGARPTGPGPSSYSASEKGSSSARAGPAADYDFLFRGSSRPASQRGADSRKGTVGGGFGSSANRFGLHSGLAAAPTDAPGPGHYGPGDGSRRVHAGVRPATAAAFGATSRRFTAEQPPPSQPPAPLQSTVRSVSSSRAARASSRTDSRAGTAQFKSRQPRFKYSTARPRPAPASTWKDLLSTEDIARSGKPTALLARATARGSGDDDGPGPGSYRPESATTWDKGRVGLLASGDRQRFKWLDAAAGAPDPGVYSGPDHPHSMMSSTRTQRQTRATRSPGVPGAGTIGRSPRFHAGGLVSPGMPASAVPGPANNNTDPGVYHKPLTWGKQTFNASIRRAEQAQPVY